MNHVKVTGQKGKLRQELLMGRHILAADVDVNSGGEDAGPSPHDYLSAALGACTAITIRMFANRKGWPLENAEVTVSLEKADETTKFERKIKLIGPLSEEQRVRLLEIANHCPVHKALTGKVEVVTSLAD